MALAGVAAGVCRGGKRVPMIECRGVDEGVAGTGVAVTSVVAFLRVRREGEGDASPACVAGVADTLGVGDVMLSAVDLL